MGTTDSMRRKVRGGRPQPSLRDLRLRQAAGPGTEVPGYILCVPTGRVWRRPVVVDPGW
jgi:hypothetical protein